ncbi:hypothetical protein ACET3Z_023750 [Daucus carota]
MGGADAFTDDILTEILKRLPKKALFRFKCVNKSWNRLIQTPYFGALQSDHNKTNLRNIYMLVFLHWGNLALYGIDPVHGLGYNSDSTDLHDLHPLLVFPTGRRMSHSVIGCVKFGSKIYLFGLDYFFSLHDEKTSVYTMEEKDLMSIEPSEDNSIANFKHLLTKTKNPMHGAKLKPLCFVANSKLYVFSGFSTETRFEVFSPVDEAWHVLPTPHDDNAVPGDFDDYEFTYLFLEKSEQVVYFAVVGYILSFNLKTHKWNPASPHRLTMLPPGEEVMQPYLAADKDFLEVLGSPSRFTYMTKRKMFYEDYIIGLEDSDNKEVMCFLTHGSKPAEDPISCPDYKTSYVALSIFRICNDLYTEKRPASEHYSTYADEEGEDGAVVRRYFNAKFLYTKHFIISNSRLHAMGMIVTCFN